MRAKRATFTKICIVAQKNFAQSNFLSAVKMKNVLLSNFSYVLICLVNSRKIASKYIITFCSYERIAQSEIFLCDSTCFFFKRKISSFRILSLMLLSDFYLSDLLLNWCLTEFAKGKCAWWSTHQMCPLLTLYLIFFCRWWPEPKRFSLVGSQLQAP